MAGAGDQELSYKLLLALARHLSKGYRKLGFELGLDEPTIYNMENRPGEVQDVNYRMLLAWKQMSGREATSEVLVEALRRVKRVDLADIMQSEDCDEAIMENLSKLGQVSTTKDYTLGHCASCGSLQKPPPTPNHHRDDLLHGAYAHVHRKSLTLDDPEERDNVQGAAGGDMRKRNVPQPRDEARGNAVPTAGAVITRDKGEMEITKLEMTWLSVQMDWQMSVSDGPDKVGRHFGLPQNEIDKIRNKLNRTENYSREALFFKVLMEWFESHANGRQKQRNSVLKKLESVSANLATEYAEKVNDNGF